MTGATSCLSECRCLDFLGVDDLTICDFEASVSKRDIGGPSTAIENSSGRTKPQRFGVNGASESLEFTLNGETGLCTRVGGRGEPVQNKSLLIIGLGWKAEEGGSGVCRKGLSGELIDGESMGVDEKQASDGGTGVLP